MTQHILGLEHVKNNISDKHKEFHFPCKKDASRKDIDTETDEQLEETLRISSKTPRKLLLIFHWIYTLRDDFKRNSWKKCLNT